MMNRNAAEADAPVLQTWLCVLCGWIYDEAAGDAGSGLEPGTRWGDVPEEWRCPECGVEKSGFEMVAI